MTRAPHAALPRIGLVLWCVGVGCASGGPGTATLAPTVPRLRVGTTGDIPPFSERTADGYRGIDIELAKALAGDLGRRAEFVPTTWTTLVRDAMQNRFDVAMGAVLVIPQRQQYVHFSDSYYSARLVVMVPCERRDDYPDLESVNRSEVVVYSRRGSAAASTAERELSRCQLREVESLREAARRVLDRDGDALVASHYTLREHPGFCEAMNGVSLFSTDVAILVPPESTLLADINAWVGRRLRDGTVRDLVRRFNVPQ